MSKTTALTNNLICFDFVVVFFFVFFVAFVIWHFPNVQFRVTAILFIWFYICLTSELADWLTASKACLCLTALLLSMSSVNDRLTIIWLKNFFVAFWNFHFKIKIKCRCNILTVWLYIFFFIYLFISVVFTLSDKKTCWQVVFLDFS